MKNNRSEKEKGIALLDEVDVILHPLFSELNFPIGKKEPLPLSPERWFFPLHLLSSLLLALSLGKEGEKEGKKEGGDEVLEELGRVMGRGREKRSIQVAPHLILLDRGFYER